MEREFKVLSQANADAEIRSDKEISILPVSPGGLKSHYKKNIVTVYKELSTIFRPEPLAEPISW